MSEAEKPAIDETAYAALEEIADGDTEFMAELLNQYLTDQFLTDAVQLIDVLAPALESSNAEDLERAAHTLKSSSANVGAMTLSNLCEDLQCIGRSGDLSEAATKVPLAISEYARVCDELKARLEKF
jgi:HPt (histidine-containing phosphotransfer) domain-containing protein